MFFMLELLEDDTFALGLMLYGAWHFMSGPIGQLATALQNAI